MSRSNVIHRITQALKNWVFLKETLVILQEYAKLSALNRSALLQNTFMDLLVQRIHHLLSFMSQHVHFRFNFVAQINVSLNGATFHEASTVTQV